MHIYWTSATTFGELIQFWQDPKNSSAVVRPIVFNT